MDDGRGDGDDKTPITGHDDDEDDVKRKTTCCCTMDKTNLMLYISHTLSAWGDRMWQFATGMFLIALNPSSLRLTAIYTLTSGAAVMLMGAIVGSWVDKYHRLTVARVAIATQNIGVALSATTVFLTVQYGAEIQVTWDGWLMTLCQIIIIFFAVFGDVASMGRTIAIERDWIVVICADDIKLTKMSALLRRIDLTTKLVAPVMTGQIITYGSMAIGALFIAAWNIVSMVIEYFLLRQVYDSVPELAEKTWTQKPEEKQGLLSNGSSARYDSISTSVDLSTTKENNFHDGSSTKSDTKQSEHGCCFLFCKDILTLCFGWRTYMQQSILLAGLSLATLYMTVLGFDNITTGFAKEQGLTESIIGILQSAGALFGVGGTLIFPLLRQKIGLENTGILSFFLELSCLVPCVLSVFAPGSPFDPVFSSKNTSAPISLDFTPDYYSGLSQSPFTEIPSDNVTSMSVVSEGGVSSGWSVWLLMGGIVAARAGLWMADLTVTQLLLEKPPDGVRGVVNGVQSSLNKFMDLVKSLLVILLPRPQTFGFLIIASFAFVALGAILFTIYALRSKRLNERDRLASKSSTASA